MFEKVLSFVCCCFPTLTSVTAPSSTSSIKRKRHTSDTEKTAFIISCRKLRMRKKMKKKKKHHNIKMILTA